MEVGRERVEKDQLRSTVNRRKLEPQRRITQLVVHDTRWHELGDRSRVRPGRPIFGLVIHDGGIGTTEPELAPPTQRGSTTTPHAGASQMSRCSAFVTASQTRSMGCGYSRTYRAVSASSNVARSSVMIGPSSVSLARARVRATSSRCIPSSVEARLPEPPVLGDPRFQLAQRCRVQPVDATLCVAVTVVRPASRSTRRWRDTAGRETVKVRGGLAGAEVAPGERFDDPDPGLVGQCFAHLHGSFVTKL